MTKSLLTAIVNAISRGAAKSGALIVAVIAVVVWAATGPWFHDGGTWQRVLNTGAPVVMFLMVLVIQHSHSASTAAVNAKLDELISTLKLPETGLAPFQHIDVEELDSLREAYVGKTTPSKSEPPA